MVVATFGLTLITRFILAPRLRDEGQGQAASGFGGVMAMVAGENVLTRTKLTAGANLAACLVAILLATRMVWELH
jgi:hypothetical protein